MENIMENIVENIMENVNNKIENNKNFANNNENNNVKKQTGEQFARTRMLLGDDAMQRLAGAKVAVFGVGGVGGYAVEALARSGVGSLVLVDADTVDITNINRQIIALLPDIGRPKVEVAAERIRKINPAACVECRQVFYSEETAADFDFREYDYVIDAIDSVRSKVNLIMQAYESGVPIVSSMGAGNKLDPGRLRIDDIYRTSVCPLARVMRRELRKRGLPGLQVVYSTEEPVDTGGERTPGSIAFVPSVAGLMLAGVVIRELVGREIK